MQVDKPFLLYYINIISETKIRINEAVSQS